MKNEIKYNGKRNKKWGQVAIELTAAFMVIFILLVSSARIFFWFCDNLSSRHQRFEQTRTIDGGRQVMPGDVKGLDYSQTKLKLVE